MYAGKPLLLAIPGEAKNILEEYSCGVVANPEDPISIANAADKLSKTNERIINYEF